jgi:hypothetical protein
MNNRIRAGYRLVTLSPREIVERFNACVDRFHALTERMCSRPRGLRVQKAYCNAFNRLDYVWTDTLWDIEEKQHSPDMPQRTYARFSEIDGLLDRLERAIDSADQRPPPRSGVVDEISKQHRFPYIDLATVLEDPGNCHAAERERRKSLGVEVGVGRVLPPATPERKRIWKGLFR